MDSAQLWTRYREQGDFAAREVLILRHAFLVRCAADRLGISASPDLDHDDLISHGIIGLIDAVEKYDHTGGPRFEAYAGERIRGAILDAARGVDRLPRPMRGAANVIERTVLELGQALGRQPTLDEVSAGSGLTEEEIEDVLARVERSHRASTEGLGAARGDGRDGSLMLMPLDGSSAGSFSAPRDGAEIQEQRRILIQAVGTLPPDERLVLSLYYFEELTLKEIGRVMSLTESRVSQIHTKAMMRIRAHLRTQADLFAAA